MLPDIALTLGTAGWATAATMLACRYHARLHTDPLTGLGNRAALYRTARRCFRPRRGAVGLLMVYLDHFKALNDTHGHAFGNRVLAAVATRLAETTQPRERTVRLHGDEFAIWLGPTTTLGHAEARAEAITRALAEPLWIDGHRLSVLGSVGLATAPAGTPLSELLAQADAHMYQVKATRKLTVLPTRSTRPRDQHPHGGHAA
ncbi:diguanylate cyclase (GGDEF) domain-containing protein [Actinopolyspora xinjiangensis]|uniref:Diguanylate cyclase (GGDEF) domain-containing protein n=1 Tax=Actinopolyspora xinjiangensis TaxID=405564 RepID=A0A1H0NNV0_9ACTN|nr:GGDEF domain-containing protein [Actinopolyspora xinjiangensis]SDO94442.1 diguanylate cyclase (GGDEF) domain-containing protein [Actinopolyspora xinjiangensis]